MHLIIHTFLACCLHAYIRMFIRTECKTDNYSWQDFRSEQVVPTRSDPRIFTIRPSSARVDQGSVMTRIWLFVCVLVLLISLGGCSIERQPLTTVDPSYSYLRGETALAESEIWPVPDITPNEVARLDRKSYNDYGYPRASARPLTSPVEK